MRTRAERRHHRERVITRRRRILLDTWSYTDPRCSGVWARLAKYNLVCSCWMCSGKGEARRDIKAARQDRSWLDEG